MAYPYFGLSKKKQAGPLEYTSPDGSVAIRVEALPRYGVASIYDADILLWLCAEIRRHYEKTGERRSTVRFDPYEMLRQIGKAKGGRQIETLKKALYRLANTFIATTVRTEHQRMDGGFHWVDSFKTYTEADLEQPSWLWEVTVSEWLVAGILQDDNILTLNTGYYRMASGLEKRLYQIARKHAGKQAHGFMVTMPVLYEKTGSTDRMREFAYQVRQLASLKGRLLDYTMKVTEIDGVEKCWFRHEGFDKRAV